MSTPLALKIAEATRDRQISVLRDTPVHARGIETFREQIAEISTVKQLVENRDLYVFVMKAFDLEDQIFGKALMRRMLESDLNDRTALVNRLTDPRFREMYLALGFENGGTANPNTGNPAWQEGIVDRYLETVFINDQAAQNEALGAALEFKRKAAAVETPLDILKDRQMGAVVRLALGLPESVGTLDIDRQASLISSRLDLATLKDPAAVDKLVRKYVILSDALDTSRASQNAAVQLLSTTANGSFAPLTIDIGAIQSVPSRPYG
ncbi:DUF1217 domain-containing protein [Roseicyclus sediminis]|uniref:DUF1217 domain-containing protein n=1 Tax=Roseicyclus sediminis TaxID=2980997 RepID=UPI0021D0ABA6|nr:DUF1217 domain-containing protein [Roseibacterium sp. SDUM158016]